MGETGWGSDTGLGYGTNKTAYGATARTNTWNTAKNKVHPRFTCPQENDKFTVETENGGNGALTYPVGLITADEIVAAGSGEYGTENESYYLNKGSWYWSFSPGYMNTNAIAYVFSISSNGTLNNAYILDSGAVAPVISLKAEYLDKLQGEGMINNPFILQV